MTASHHLPFPSFSFSLFTVLIACACGAPPTPSTSNEAPAPPPPQKAPKWIPGPDPQEIKQAVNARGAELRQCYLLGTFRNSQLTGTVNVLFTIDTLGKVSRAADAGSDIEDPEVVTCVLDVFGNLEFARGGSSDTEVEYPVVFGARG